MLMVMFMAALLMQNFHNQGSAHATACMLADELDSLLTQVWADIDHVSVRRFCLRLSHALLLVFNRLTGRGHCYGIVPQAYHQQRAHTRQ